MEADSNLELRKDILERALTLESSINQLLISYLNIDNQELKTLGNKSSSLSFKNKIDLLSDLGVFTKEENKKFVFLMEFRNQFLHNINCNSFEKAIEILGKDRGSQLLKYDDLDFDASVEFRYQSAFNKIVVTCLETIIEKYSYKKKQLQLKRKVVTDICEYSKHVIDKDSELFTTLMDKCLPDFQNDSKEILAFKMHIHSTIKNFHDLMMNDEKYILLSQQVDNFNEEHVKAFYK